MTPMIQAESEQQVVVASAEAPIPDNHELLVQYFEDSEEATRDARMLAERDRDYYDNKQLTAEEIAALKKRGQPQIIINRIQTKVNFLLGYEASQRSDPRGYPRTPQDEDAAGACTDALRYIRDKTVAPQVFSDAWENMLIEGYGACEVGVTENSRGERDVTLTHVPWDRVFYDPHSRRHDFSDSRYQGVVLWLDEDDAVRRWPNGKDIISRTILEDGTRTYSDRPAWKQWAVAGHRKRVRVVQMYYQNSDTWSACIFTRGGKLQSWDVPWTDDDGKSFCPLLLQSAFVDRENNRYGFVRSLISPQDEINKRRSKLLHLAMGKPFTYEEGAIDDVDEAKRQLAMANGAIKLNSGYQFSLLDNSVEVAGHTNLLQHATNEIDQQGPNAVLSGKGERGASGRAKMVDQQGGQTEIYRLIDRHANLKRRVYNTCWSIVRQEWTGQKWIRVTDDEKNARFVGFNRPVIMAEDLLKQAKDSGVPEEEAKAQLAQQAQDPNIAMQMQQVVRTENIPAEMNMDIILEEVPDTANLQQEQFEIMVQLAQAGIQFPPKVYIKASALRDKQELLKILEEAQQNPEAQAVGQANMDKLAAEIEKLKATIADIKASAIKKLAEADALDKQFGSVIDPEIVDPKQAGGMQPMPQYEGAQQQMQQPEQPQLAPEAGMMQGGGYPPEFDPGQYAQQLPQVQDMGVAQ